MATLVGNNGAISVNGKACAAVRNFSIDITADTIETTTMGVEARTYVKGLSTFSGSADIYFDTADWDGAGEPATWNPTDSSNLVGASGVTGKFYLDLDASGTNADKAFTGTVIVTGYTINSSFDGMVEASISFQGSDAVTYSTSNVVYP
jgi:predicted secreted protein